MKDSAYYNEIWTKGRYRLGSTALRLIPWLMIHLPPGIMINDYGSGTGRADVELVKRGFRVNMVDIADAALEPEARALIGKGLTYTVSPLESLPENFPHAQWGICINVLMTSDPDKLDEILAGMRRTCDNLIVETYDTPDFRLGKDLTLIKGDLFFWKAAMARHWPIVESFMSPEVRNNRVVTIGRSA